MKHNHLLKTTILLLGGGLAALTGFASCDNFLKNGEDVKNEIVDSIAYNNAPSCTINFSNEGMGEFLGNKKETFKVGYASQVQFEVYADDYYFVGLEAVTNNSEKTPLTGYVEFEPVNDDDRNAENGIYKYNVKILKEGKDILIRPVCKLLPKIIQITPKFESSGCDQDTAIQITFNKAINPQTFAPACISIFAEEDLAQYFNTPQFTSDNKTIYISPKELILKPNDTKSFLNIEVDYDFTSLKDSDDLTLKAQGTHSYKINKSFGDQKIEKIQPQTDDAYGAFLSTGEKECTVGYAIDIQFTLKKQDYKFIKFVPVITNGSTEAPADCIIFENEEYNEQTGIYKTGVKVTRALNDKEYIIVRPECYKLPKVLSHTPSDTEVQTSDIPIQINFNMAMELENVKPLIIYTDSKQEKHEMSQYFEAPYLDEQKKTLVIQPKPVQLSQYIDNEGITVLNLSISFSEETKVINNEQELPLVQDENASFKIRYKKDIYDTTPPVKKDFFFATKEKIALDDSNKLTDCEKFYTGTFNAVIAIQNEEEYKNKVLHNRVTDYFYIYGHYYDADSGVKKVVVNQEGCDPRDFYVNAKYTTGTEFITDENGYTTFRIEYQMEKVNDAFTITVNVLDACDKSSAAETFYVVSRASYSADDMCVKIQNGPEEVHDGDDLLTDMWHLLSDYVQNDKDEFNLLMEDFNQAIKTIRLYKNATMLYLYRANNKPRIISENVTYSCEYTDEQGIEQKIAFPKFENDKEYSSIDLNIGRVCGKQVKIIAEDSYGAKGEYILKFPPKVVFEPDVPMINYDRFKNGYLIFEDSAGNLQFNSSSYTYFSISDNTTPVGFVFWSEDVLSGVTGDSYLHLLSDYLTFNINNEIPEITGCTITKDTNNRANITFTFANDTWNKFDAVQCEIQNNGELFERFLIRKEDTTTNTNGTTSYLYIPECNFRLDYGSPDLFAFDDKCNFIFKGGTETWMPDSQNKVEYTFNDFEITPPTAASYDDIPPVINQIKTSYDTFLFSLYDYEDLNYSSGRNKATLTIGKKKYEITGSLYTVEIPAFELYNALSIEDDYCDGDIKCPEVFVNYTALDSNGNKNESCVIVKWKPDNKVQSISQNGKSVTIKNKQGNAYDIAEVYTLSQTGWNLICSGKNVILTAPDEASSDVFTNQWLKICASESFKYCRSVDFNDNPPPAYIYTGSASSKQCDIMMPYGNSANSYVVSSKAPVLVQTVYISDSFKELDSLTPAYWCQYGKEVDVQCLNFSEQDMFSKIYGLPDTAYDKIPENSYYVTIAHYASGMKADGNVLISEVKHK